MKELPLNVIDPGTKSHPHRASAGTACHFVGVAVPAMQHGGGSKLKGLLRVPLRRPSSSHSVHLRIEGLARSACPRTAWPCGPVDLSPTLAAQRAN